MAPDNWYDTFKDFQAGLGLLGVGITLYVNYRLTNRKRLDDIAADRAATRTALMSELRSLSASVRRSKMIFDKLKAEGHIAFPRAFSAEALSRVYRAVLPKIGLLATNEVELVVIAYSRYEDLAKMSEESTGDAQTRASEREKLISFNAYVKGLSDVDAAISDAINVLNKSV